MPDGADLILRIEDAVFESEKLKVPNVKKNDGFRIKGEDMSKVGF